MRADNDQLGSWHMRRIVRTMFPLLIVLSVVVLWAGITLESAHDLLESYGLLAVIVPPMIAMGGNLGAILSSRLTTRFHLGIAVLDLHDRILWANIVAILALAATIFSALAIAAYGIGFALEIGIPLSALLLISLISGMSVALIAVVFSFVVTYASFRFGIDPDDTTIPIVTNVVDVAGMIIFIAVSSTILEGV